jgi:hypothetical protein
MSLQVATLALSQHERLVELPEVLTAVEAIGVKVHVVVESVKSMCT